MDLNHISEDALDEYVLGRSTETDRRQIEGHLLFCPECRDRLAAMGELIAVLREMCAANN